MKKFNVGDTVSFSLKERYNGKVKFLCCFKATPSGQKNKKPGDISCEKESCICPNKNFVWVQWPGQTRLFSYFSDELNLQHAAKNVEAINKAIGSDSELPESLDHWGEYIDIMMEAGEYTDSSNKNLKNTEHVDDDVVSEAMNKIREEANLLREQIDLKDLDDCIVDVGLQNLA